MTIDILKRTVPCVSKHSSKAAMDAHKRIADVCVGEKVKTRNPEWNWDSKLSLLGKALFYMFCMYTSIRHIRVVRDITPDNHLIHLAMKSPQPDKLPKDFVLLVSERPRMEYEG